MYDGDDDTSALLDAANGYHALLDDKGEPAGFCCFGPDARVPGGDYPDDALDVGLGLRPDLVGHGLGRQAASAAFDLAGGSTPLRVTVAKFNCRAIRLCEGLGFERTSSFTDPRSGRRFIQLRRPPRADPE